MNSPRFCGGTGGRSTGKSRRGLFHVKHYRFSFHVKHIYSDFDAGVAGVVVGEVESLEADLSPAPDFEELSDL